jgi:hypothetical protein
LPQEARESYFSQQSPWQSEELLKSDGGMFLGAVDKEDYHSTPEFCGTNFMQSRESPFSVPR